MRLLVFLLLTIVISLDAVPWGGRGGVVEFQEKKDERPSLLCQEIPPTACAIAYDRWEITQEPDPG